MRILEYRGCIGPDGDEDDISSELEVPRGV